MLFLYNQASSVVRSLAHTRSTEEAAHPDAACAAHNITLYTKTKKNFHQTDYANTSSPISIMIRFCWKHALQSKK